MEYDDQGRIKVDLRVTANSPQPAVLGPKLVFGVQRGVKFTTDPGVTYRIIAETKYELAIETFFDRSR